MIEAWMKCNMDKGMFPGEVGIFFKDLAGNDVSLFSSEKFINKEESVLLVSVLSKTEKSAHVRLPVQSFNGTTDVEVSSENLKEVMQVA
ncbi:MAG: hypothetical protein IPG59_22875 [Candidatus Melainabacteria bacterium]|nr:MAG: hypothetical protein IPG59_22875 [Candidatus Melainabacteria bacterium]